MEEEGRITAMGRSTGKSYTEPVGKGRTFPVDLPIMNSQ